MNGIHEVTGSIPVRSTIFFPPHCFPHPLTIPQRSAPHIT